MSEKYEDQDREEYDSYLDDLKSSANFEQRQKVQKEREELRLLPTDKLEEDDPIPNQVLPPPNTVPPPPRVENRDDDDDEDDDYEIKFRGLYSASSSEEEKGHLDELSKKPSTSQVMDEDIEDDEEEEDVIEKDEDMSWDQVEILDEASEAKMVQQRRANRMAPDFEEYLIGETKTQEEEIAKPPTTSTEAATKKTDADELDEIPVLLQSLKESKDEIYVQLTPILRKLKLKKQYLTQNGRKYLALKYRLLQLYVLNILFYFKLCVKKGDNDFAFQKRRNHPVMDRLVQTRRLLEKVKTTVETKGFLEDFQLVQKIFNERKKKEDGNKNNKKKKKKKKKKIGKEKESENLMNQFSSFKDTVTVDDEDDNITGKKRKRVPGKKKKGRPAKRSKVMRRIEEDREMSFRTDVPQKDTRDIHPNIMKSKGIREKGKEFVHPRIKKRMVYHNRTKEKRRMEKRYNQEKGGVYHGEDIIKKRTVRSRRLRK